MINNQCNDQSYFDSNGTLIKANDVIKVSKARAGEGFVLMQAKYDAESQRLLFYNDVVAYAWEDLQLSQVKSIVVLSGNNKEKE